jgi:hypothetical protein
MQDLRPRELPDAIATPPITAEFFRVNPRDRAWVDRQCTPHPVACITEKLTLTGAGRAVKRRTYIRAADFAMPVFDAFYNRFKDDPGWAAHALPCGHDVMVDMPEALADLLEQAA